MAVGPSQGPVKATRSPTKAAGKSEGIKNLIGAAENGDLATVRLLLEQGSNPNPNPNPNPNQVISPPSASSWSRACGSPPQTG